MNLVLSGCLPIVVAGFIDATIWTPSMGETPGLHRKTPRRLQVVEGKQPAYRYRIYPVWVD